MGGDLCGANRDPAGTYRLHLRLASQWGATPRLKHGIRVYFPYEARHLDWYISDAQARTSSDHHTSSGKTSHWNNAGERQAHCNEPSHENGPMIYVERDRWGDLLVRRLELEQRRPD